MADNNLPQSPPDSQALGLIRYLSEASDISRGNFELRQLERISNARSPLFESFHRWAMTYAHDPKKLPVQTLSKHQFYSLLEQLADAYGQMWALKLVSHYQQAQPALPPALSEHVAALPQGNPAPHVRVVGPVFRSRQQSNAVRRQQTPTQRRVWQRYYEAHCCLVCETRERPYFSNGLCGRCHGRVWKRLAKLKREEG